ncbi:MAG TPA: phage integrase SAM-like domain-containing protein [Flavisolibacter sp.]|nr:phage integrase SAM-like domain-containing protein [Flavisolibacter sp.]
MSLKEVLDTQLRKIEPEKEQQKTFLGFFEEIVNQTRSGTRLQPKTGNPYTKATIQVSANTLNRVKEFTEAQKKVIDFETINLEFYSDFTEYLTKTLKLASNTIGKDIKTITVIMNEATERSLNTNLQYKSRKFSVTSENTDSIYLTNSELKEIEALYLSRNKRLENVRDLFLIGCYTGLCYSDFSFLQPKHIKDGFIETTQIKTGERIVIPVHPTVERILEKYKGQLLKSISNQKTNDYLKELGQTIAEGKKEPVLNESVSRTFTKRGVKFTHSYKKWQLLTTHTA